MDANIRSNFSWPRAAGIAFGIGTQLFFAVTVCYLFLFLRDGSTNLAGNWLLVDSLLALQFAVVHSWLLLPSSRSSLSRMMPSQFHGSLFCVATCSGLWLMFIYWRCSSFVVWEATGWGLLAVRLGFYASWVSLFLTLRMTGFGYQTGWTQWLYWYRHQPLPRRAFNERGVFRVLRHPAYLSFLGLIWFTPRMTADHAVLTGTWTVYIYVGSYLKDKRLEFYLGDFYREYASRVPGYPGMLFGPLAKWRRPVATPKAGDLIEKDALPQAA
jgi:methanethiol S-methyltransferase